MKNILFSESPRCHTNRLGKLRIEMARVVIPHLRCNPRYRQISCDEQRLRFANPAAQNILQRLGVDTILTSGQQADCTAGADLLRALVAKAGEDVQILVGAGVNADVIRDLQPKTGANAFHLSAKRVENSRMQFRRENVPMGLPGLSEFSLWQCDENAVRAAREAFDACCGAGQEART